MKVKKDINNIHDKSYKDLLSNKKVFVDLISTFINAPWAKGINADDLSLVNKEFININPNILKSKEFKLPAVVPIVLYNGESQWTAKKEFRDIVHNSNMFSNHIINFEYFLLDLKL